jgi:predicted nucleotidyltransferase
MPKRKIVKVIQELNKLIKEQFPDLKGLYLYGSHVKGDTHKYSDIDIVALFDEISREKTFEIGGILSDLMYKYDTYIDFQPYTIDDLRENPYYYDEVVNKGIYYAAA